MIHANDPERHAHQTVAYTMTVTNISSSRQSPKRLQLRWWATDTTSIFFNLLALYLLAYFFFYPYGVPITGTATARLVDLVALLCIALGGLALVQHMRINATVLVFWPILPFLAMELLLPLAGVVVFDAPGGVFNAGRLFILHAPVLIAACFCATARLDELHRRITRMLQIILIANFIYASMQLAVGFGVLPEGVLFMELLTPFAVDDNYDTVRNLRESGFFANATGLSQMGIVAIAYFLARYQEGNRRSDLFFALLGMATVVLSTSRAAYVGMFLIIGWMLAQSLLSLKVRRIRQVFTIGMVLGVAGALMLWLIATLFGFEEFFARFIRIFEGGLENDYSFSTRANELWPTVLAKVHAYYPYGTLLPAPQVLGLIDSGYLTYYAQGRWLMLGSLILLFASLIVYTQISLRGWNNWSRHFVFFLLLYIIPAMVVTNPMRSPLIVFMLYYGMWAIHCERQWKHHHSG